MIPSTRKRPLFFSPEQNGRNRSQTKQPLPFPPFPPRPPFSGHPPKFLLQRNSAPFHQCLPGRKTIPNRTPRPKSTTIPFHPLPGEREHPSSPAGNGQLLPGVDGGRAFGRRQPRRGQLLQQRRAFRVSVLRSGPEQAAGAHRAGAGPAHGGREEHLQRGQGARPRTVRGHLAVHPQGDGPQVRVQDHQQEEAVHQGGRGGRPARGPDHVPPGRPARRGGAQGRLRGQALGAPRHGALRRRRALRPDHRQGPLHGARGGRAAAHHRGDHPHLPLHGRHPPRPQARELPPAQQGRERAAQGHRLRPLRLLQRRGGVQGHRGQRILHRAGGAEAELRAGGGHLERRRHVLHPALRRPALLGRVGARHLQLHPERAGGLRQRPVVAHLQRRQGPRQEDAHLRPQEEDFCLRRPQSPVDQGRRRGARHAAGQRRPRQAQAVHGHEPVQEGGAEGDRRVLVGGGDQGAQGDVQGHGLGQQRHHHRRRAPERAGQEGDQAYRSRSPAAHGSRGRGRERDDRLRGVHHGDDAHEQDGPGGAPLHRLPVLRQGQQRVHHDRGAGAGPEGEGVAGRSGYQGHHIGGRRRQRREDQLHGVRGDDEERDPGGGEPQEAARRRAVERGGVS